MPQRQSTFPENMDSAGGFGIRLTDLGTMREQGIPLNTFTYSIGAGIDRTQAIQMQGEGNAEDTIHRRIRN
jgi:hypothetical protein